MGQGMIPFALLLHFIMFGGWTTFSGDAVGSLRDIIISVSSSEGEARDALLLNLVEIGFDTLACFSFSDCCKGIA